MIIKLQHTFLKLTIAASMLLMHLNKAEAQISFTATSLTKSENFNGMTALVLPTGITANAATSVGTSASSLSSSSGGNSYKFISGTDFAIGFLNSGSFTTGKTIVAQYVNNTGSVITQLDIAFDYEKYRSGSRAWEFIFATGTNGTAYTTVASGGHSFAADAGNTVASFPPLVTSKTLTITGLNIANGGSYYLRWTLSGNGGSSNGQALGIDNLVVTATIAGASCAVPTDLVKSNIKDTSVDISWTAASGSPAGYEYAVTTSATPPTSGTAVTGTSASVSSLTFDTKYYIHLRTDCGSSNFSSWITDSATTALPVKLVRFIGKQTGAQVQLSWSTAQEINNSHFEIERSDDNKNFAHIASVRGKGNASGLNTYSFNDAITLGNITYYRLKQVDFDGAYAYSNVVTINANDKEAPQAVIYPNPVNGRGELRYSVTAASTVQVSIYDLVGHEIKVLVNEQQNEGDHTILLPELKKGIYFIRVNSNGKSQSTRVVFE